MKQSRFYISLYIIIPFIITGLTILAGIISFRLTKYNLGEGADPAQPVFWFIIGVGILTFVIGFALVRFILKPVEQFVAKAVKLASISGDRNDKGKEWSVNKIEQFTTVFDRVTSVLSRMDARHFFPQIIGESLAMRGLLSLIKKVAPTDSTVLILGESGTGKELVATSIYENCLRKNKPFIKLNCAAIPTELLESELFGHEKGAFTGASTRRKGKIEIAHNGTLFLDEIGEMSPNIQVHLLRVLEEKEFTRVGGNELIKVDVRLVSATNRDLQAALRDNKFREDLYYRLNVVTIDLPPLRERTEDILLLAEFFLKKFAIENMKRVTGFSKEVTEFLFKYPWPGNVRELENTVERAVILAQEEEIQLKDLLQKNSPLVMSSPVNYTLSEVEIKHIRDVLNDTGGNYSHAAKILGISRVTLYNKVKKYKIGVKE